VSKSDFLFPKIIALNSGVLTPGSTSESPRGLLKAQRFGLHPNIPGWEEKEKNQQAKLLQKKWGAKLQFLL